MREREDDRRRDRKNYRKRERENEKTVEREIERMRKREKERTRKKSERERETLSRDFTTSVYVQRDKGTYKQLERHRNSDKQRDIQTVTKCVSGK